MRNRVSLLVAAERACGWIHVHHKQAHLLLGLPTQESSKCPSFPLSHGSSLTSSPQDQVAKTGYLSKSGKRTSKQNRYWFRLKGDVLSYYHDATNLYSPHGQIDLRYGISAEIIDRDKEGVHFDVTTDQRTYHFKADSPPSAKEWVKSIQRVIFRSHNDGDSVKISLPIGNVLDIEETRMMNLDFADTVKIRVIDNDETYAVDEVSV